MENDVKIKELQGIVTALRKQLKCTEQENHQLTRKLAIIEESEEESYYYRMATPSSLDEDFLITVQEVRNFKFDLMSAFTNIQREFFGAQLGKDFMYGPDQIETFKYNFEIIQKMIELA